MRAIAVQSYASHRDAAVLTDMPVPETGDGDVLIAVKAAGVNFPDMLAIEGKYQHKPDCPFIPGMECAGIVETVGKNVTDLKPGDRVVAITTFGAFAEKLAAPRHQVFRVPDAVPLADAAASALVGQTAWFALVERGRLKESEWVFVAGASGGVGLAAVLLARALGAVPFAGVTTPSKAYVAEMAGAEMVVDLSGPGLKDQLRDDLRKATGGPGMDLVIDPLGGDVFDASLRCLDWCGRLVVVGFATGRIAMLKSNYLLLKNIEVSGLDWNSYREKAPSKTAEAMARIFEFYEDGKFRLPIQTRIPMENWTEAFDIIAERHVEGRIVLDIEPE